MNVHIVCRDHFSDRVMPRMTRLLANSTGWTLSGKPDPKADINYLFPYLEHRTYKGPFAAYFTHREDSSPIKVAIWREQAARATLRITSARQYADDLMPHGAVRAIRPPLDRKRFAPTEKAAHRRPVIGVSGYTYGGGRKGEKMLEAALQQMQQYDWRAIGRGWPLPTREVPDKLLPAWYNSLDLYVCPSLIEGVPYGPLEALSCGVPVVIPVGVGLLDELPDVPGIVRYKCGSAESLALAVREALDITPDRDALRAATEDFTEENWVNGHMQAFAELESKGATVNTPPTGSNRGIYIVAYGAPARECSKRLTASVRKHLPGVPVAIVSDSPVGVEDVAVYHPDADLGGRTAKTKMYELTPPEWEQVLYLDADTELTADISFLFDALTAGWEMVLTKDVDDYDQIYSLWRRDSSEHNLGAQAIGSARALQLAGGVVAFRRCPATERFFGEWYREWKVLARRDQGALIRAFYANPVRTLVLGNEWNSFTGIFTGVSAGVTHHRGGPARREVRWGAGRLDDPKGFGRLRRNKYQPRKREAIMPENEGVWFVHTATGNRQHATEGGTAFRRFEKSPMWQREDEYKAVQTLRADDDSGNQSASHSLSSLATEFVETLQPLERERFDAMDGETQMLFDRAVCDLGYEKGREFLREAGVLLDSVDEAPAEIKHVGNGLYELPGGDRIKGRNAAMAEQERREAAHEQGLASLTAEFFCPVHQETEQAPVPDATYDGDVECGGAEPVTLHLSLVDGAVTGVEVAVGVAQ